MRGFPIARLERSGGGAARGEKCHREVAVLNANEIFSTLPQARPPLVQTVQLLVQERRNFAALAVVRLHRFYRRGVCHRQIAEAAEPSKPNSNRPAIELDRSFHTDY